MKSYRTPVRALVIAAAAIAAAPLCAQTPPEEIVVTGNVGTVPSSVRTLSQPVSYADLDLSTSAGKDELRHRVSLTARFLCNKLGESASSSGPVPSCRDAATRDAMTRVGTVEEHFAPRGTTWARPPVWQPPYPADWAQTYP
jgi:UrcA family protein